ncbi:hypothetical protein VII00023_06437 [Vibrio ichthyoenteri ATCC 700023]|uniref:Uncharacterized protein n=1 Tax=Vibrio ichthyoenteri ATCC 700023 TaxID=870968 RepID=F9S6J9_9VIBR|nr:hypothetical protein [Vibrio ichthyoenteri]EGU32656.1 hypothetical protein VII00023_06437 [Vibrio ichthyoenteri ATCC 700023]
MQLSLNAVKLTIATALLSLISFSASANDFCQQNLLPILKQAYPTATALTNNDGEPYQLQLHDEYKRSIDLGFSSQAVCKVWPSKPELTLLAVKLDYYEEEQLGWAASTADLEILVVDTKSKQILARQLLVDALFSDAISVDSIALDTARYHLNDHITAFGVTVKRSSHSGPNPYNSKTLSLFQFDATQPQGKQISLLVDSLIVNQFGGESDTTCAGEFWRTKRIVIINNAKQQAPNLSPLTVKTQVKHFRSTREEDSFDCIDSTIDIKKETTTLRFDGTQYPVAKEMRYHF